MIVQYFLNYKKLRERECYQPQYYNVYYSFTTGQNLVCERNIL